MDLCAVEVLQLHEASNSNSNQASHIPIP